jgi:hypothetical protein
MFKIGWPLIRWPGLGPDGAPALCPDCNEQRDY